MTTVQQIGGLLLYSDGSLGWDGGPRFPQEVGLCGIEVGGKELYKHPGRGTDVCLYGDDDKPQLIYRYDGTAWYPSDERIVVQRVIPASTNLVSRVLCLILRHGFICRVSIDQSSNPYSDCLELLPNGAVWFADSRSGPHAREWSMGPFELFPPTPFAGIGTISRLEQGNLAIDLPEEERERMFFRRGRWLRDVQLRPLVLHEEQEGLQFCGNGSIAVPAGRPYPFVLARIAHRASSKHASACV